MTAASDELGGRTFLITGGNTGIGLATATALASRGGRVYLACRSADRGRAAAAAIAAASGSDAVMFLPLDLASLASVRSCAEQFLARDEPLHVLINNAGVAGRRGVTADGYELAFGVNHLGHFALTTALLGRLAGSAPARVVTVASDAHTQARGVDFEAVRKPTASFTGMPEYAVSKLCNVLFSAELARRVRDQGITSYSLHPGVAASDIWRRVPWPVRPLIKLRMISPEEGARTTLHCAASADAAAQTGLYYEKSRPREPGRAAIPELASDLWQRSEAWLAG